MSRYRLPVGGSHKKLFAGAPGRGSRLARIQRLTARCGFFCVHRKSIPYACRCHTSASNYIKTTAEPTAATPKTGTPLANPQYQTREPPGCGNVIARVDIALNDDVKVYNLKVSQRADGGYAVFAPNALGGRVVTFSRELVQEIASAAVAALMEPTPYDRSAA
ncbi:hypothetical protein [Mesorhizobium mediterraneum]|uniref:hypothetical protein n=1 Tax=Mesorhizobium mediterraneum TaxID=43617 RepID=UPI001781C104|nr:hypothetical protein [Mesorhizobium mediterraneum]